MTVDITRNHYLKSWKYSLDDVFNFGKYKDTNVTVGQAIKTDIQYVKWALLNTRFDLDSVANSLFEDLIQDV